MVSVLVEDLPPAASSFFHRRARRAGTESVKEHVRHELMTLAREPAPIDHVVRFVEQTYGPPAQPELDHDATALRGVYRLPADVWNTLWLRASASGVSVSNYVYDELVAVSRRSTLDDVMWELAEAQEADPSLNIDFEAALKAARYARGLD